MKNRGLYILFVILGVSLFLSSCKKFDELNTDPKNPLEADAGLLFAYAEKELAYHYNNCNVNRNVSRLLAQYWSQVTYTNESRYLLEIRQVNDNNWDVLYRNVLNNLAAARVNIKNPDSKIKANQNAVIDILEIFIYQLMVDIYGPVPYSQALKGKESPNPKYDSAEDIYGDLMSRIDVAIENLSDAEIFGNQDIMYNSDVTRWKKFANSLKIKLAIRVLDTKFKDDAEKAIAEAVPDAFTTNADNASFPFRDGSKNGNPLYSELVLSGREDFVPSKTLVDIMNGFNDPRRALFMTLKEDKYVGLEYGKIVGDAIYSDYSHVSEVMRKATFPGALLEYSQIAFMLAEAAEKGIDVGKSAEEYYNDAVKSSINLWGGSEEDGNTYLAQPEVAYSTAEGDPMKAIAVQKWIAQYNHGYEGWIEWRRLDHPTFHVPEQLTVNDIPKRQKYPINEVSLNKSNYDDAVKMLKSEDGYSSRIFWDVK